MKLSSLPRQIPMSVYSAAREALLEKHAATPGVLALLEFGTIPLPGISDIDFFIVTEPDTRINLPRFHEYPEDQRYAMNSLQCVITPQTFAHLTYYDPWFIEVKTRLDISGGTFSNFQKEKLPDDAYRALSLHFIFEKLVYGCLPFLADAETTRTIEVRRFFEEAKQSKYFYRELDRIGVPHPDDPGMSAADAVAREWFTMPEADRERTVTEAYEAFQRSVTIVLCALSRFLASAPMRPFTPPRQPTFTQREWLHRYPRSLIIETPGRVFVYQEGRTQVVIETETVKIPTVPAFDITTIVLPLACAAMATQHLFTSGDFSSYYRSCACTDLSSVPCFSDASLVKLSEIQNNNLHALRNVRGCKFYEMRFGYRPRPDRPSLGMRISSLYQRCSLRVLRSFLYPWFITRPHTSVWTVDV